MTDLAMFMIRFIPACAGNARRSALRCTAPSVHPRVCGERILRNYQKNGVTGSSPRVRGTRRWPGLHQVSQRFIPACAGNAHSPHDESDQNAVHPRVCGERISSTTCAPHGDGSSPRVRGTPSLRRSGRRRRRFIPACAGNARSCTGPSGAPAVHPRVCGERALVRLGRDPHPGSSPRVRGTPFGGSGKQFGDRFIPACAGNARPDAKSGARGTVHPRVCGERESTDLIRTADYGSSPRVRGTRIVGSLRARRRRFIPACAGNATAGWAAFLRNAVHPRVCGERYFGAHYGDASDGSSPRVRGTQR